MNGWTLSIDFGTSNTSAAHTNPLRGFVEPATLTDNNHSMASSVLVDTSKDVVAGPVALARADSFPTGFIPSPKRLISQPTVWIDGHDVPVQSVIDSVFEEAIRRAMRNHNNQRPRHLVITHPEVWSPTEIAVLKKAAVDAGMPPQAIATVSEPQAAVAYYTQDKALAPGQKIAVFDIGGGTLDVAVLRCGQRGGFDVLSADGDNAIGGRSFDSQLRRWVESKLDEEHPDLLEMLRSSGNSYDNRQLDRRVTEAKELLSETDHTVIHVECEAESHHLELSREEFESIIRPNVERAVRIAASALAHAQVGPGELHALYLTGGSSRIPLIQRELAGIGPVAQLDNPKTVVCQGALIAIQNAINATRPAAPRQAPPPPQQVPSAGPMKTIAPRRSSAPHAGTMPQPGQRVVSPRRRRK